MSSDLPQPRIIDKTWAWVQKTQRTWQFLPPVDLRGAVDPPVVEAASGHILTVTLTLGPELSIPTGGHIILEIPATWDGHLGNCFRRNIRAVGNRDQIRPGYGAWTDAECSNPDVQLALAASYERISDLVDVVVQRGEIGPGDQVRIILGSDEGNLIQPQKHAQVAVLPVGVDLEGNGDYRRAAVHPMLEVIGAYPDRLRIFAPGSVQPDEPFTFRVLPVDIYSFNPGTGYRGEPMLASTEGLNVPARASVDTEADPRGVTCSATASEPGVHYITACDPATGIAGRSNPIGAGFYEDRMVYFGELHSQMWLSMGTGTTSEYFGWGRDVAGLDFCAPANHYNQRFEVTESIWQDLVHTCNAYDDPGRFATLIGYEWGGVSGSGHKNVYFRGDTGKFAYWYRREHADPDAFWGSLEGQDVLTVPHHSKYMGGADWSYRSDTFQRLVEICSNWGISETDGPRSVQAALAMGHRFGFVGGTDSHYGLANQGSYHVNDGNGLACVVAQELTRDALWQAMYDRRCYATTGDRILLDFTVDGQPMGSDLPVDLSSSTGRSFSMRVAGTAPIDVVEIVRNNRVVYEAHPRLEVWGGDWADDEPLSEVALQPTFPGDRPFVFYYLRIIQRNRQRAWSSPIWLTQEA